MARHNELTGNQLHEPKGATSAPLDSVYVANGAGSGTWQPIKGESFQLASKDTLVISTDKANPSYMTGNIINVSNGSFGLSDATTGSVKNTGGRTYGVVKGTLSFQPDNVGGTSATIQIFSESSLDNGVTWVMNPNSLRSVEVPATGESFRTLVSFYTGWAPNQCIRFGFVMDAGTASFAKKSDTIKGTVVDSYSFLWTMTTVG